MDTIEELKKLKTLLDQGAITTEEFNELKKKNIGGQTQIPLKESNMTNNSQSTSKRRPSFLKKILLISVFPIITAVVVLGIKYIEPIKEKIASVLQKPNAEKKDVAYEGKKKLGKIVKVEIEGVFPHSGGGLIPLNVPDGKMWTPLYFDQITGKRDVSVVEIFNKTRSGYSYNDYYEFDITKNLFVSGKYSKQNNKSFVGRGQVGVSITSFSSTRTVFAFYFLEESY